MTTKKDKGYNLDQLAQAFEDRKMYRATVERAIQELKVAEGKFKQLREELAKAEAELHKVDQSIRNIAQDLE